MSHFIAIGCDLHDRSITLAVAFGKNPATIRRYANDGEGREKMVSELLAVAGEQGVLRIVLVYEASGQGFRLCDWLQERGIETYVLAPTKLARSAQQTRRKTDARDAEALLEDLRSHLLAGRPLPSVWIPSRQLREDRELVRARHEVADLIGQTKTKIRSLLRKHWIDMPDWFTVNQNWTRQLQRWLNQLETGSDPRLPHASRCCLRMLLSRLEELQDEQKQLDGEIRKLCRDPRYRPSYQALRSLCGVGQVTAMTFLTELGDLSRFENRRQLAAFLGLVPSSNESGERSERKGHVTRQGPARLRRVLCQAAWAAIRHHEATQQTYQHLKRNTKTRTRIAVVAIMRRLAIRMWHQALEAMCLCGGTFAWARQKDFVLPLAPSLRSPSG
jgi:transposase